MLAGVLPSRILMVGKYVVQAGLKAFAPPDTLAGQGRSAHGL